MSIETRGTITQSVTLMDYKSAITDLHDGLTRKSGVARIIKDAPQKIENVDYSPL